MTEEKKEELICIEKVCKSYGKHTVIKDMDLTVYRGDILGVVGKNGCGKTTLFKLILGLSPYQSGTIRMKKISGQAPLKIGFFVGQQFFGERTARENLRYFAMLKGINNVKEEIERVLKLVSLDQAKGSFQRFSLGMKQRLGIANAMLGNPDLLILDEPTNGLDPQGIADIRKLLKRLNTEYGITIIISSHILGELQNTATRFAMMNQGKIIQCLTYEEFEDSSMELHVNSENWEHAKQLLLENGIHILKESIEKRTLEDYYFELIGGREDA